MQKEYKLPFWKYFLIFCPCVMLLGPLGIIAAVMIKRHLEKTKNEELSQTQPLEDTDTSSPTLEMQEETKTPISSPPNEPAPPPEKIPAIPPENLKYTPQPEIIAEKKASPKPSNEDKNTAAIVIIGLVLLGVVGLVAFGALKLAEEQKESKPYHAPAYSEAEPTNIDVPDEKPNFTYDEYRDLRSNADKAKKYNAETTEFLDSKFGRGFSDAIVEESSSNIDSAKKELAQVISDYNSSIHRFSTSEMKSLGAKLITNIQMQPEALLTIMGGTREENMQRIGEVKEQVSKRYTERFTDREIYFFCRSFYSTDSNGKVEFGKIDDSEKLYLMHSMKPETMTKMQEILSEAIKKKPAIEYPR